MRVEARIASEIFNCSVRELYESEFYSADMVEWGRTILEAEYMARESVKPETVH